MRLRAATGTLARQRGNTYHDRINAVVVLAAVCFISQNDDIWPIAEDLRGLELVDESEDIAVVST